MVELTIREELFRQLAGKRGEMNISKINVHIVTRAALVSVLFFLVYCGTAVAHVTSKHVINTAVNFIVFSNIGLVFIKIWCGQLSGIGASSAESS